MKVLITGSAGFIGFFLAKALLARGDSVVGVDNLNDYYDPVLKRARLQDLEQFAQAQQASQRFSFIQMEMADRVGMTQLFERHTFDVVVNLGAQAGVRYSIDNPNAYVDSNVVGFLNVLEGCRHSGVNHLVYASSSSVYGMNVKQPFSTADRVDYPISLYAATKKSNELMAHTYSHLFNIPTTGLRFFTVYGPWGRPDMAYFKFTKAILAGKPIDVYNHGDMLRDFTYIDDIIEGVVRIIDRIPQPQVNATTTVQAPYKIYNIGNNQPVTLRRFITALETALGQKAVENHLPMQPGDVPTTYANIDGLIADIGFKPQTRIEDGIGQFVDWYQQYYC
mgnify:CR=1 FL=1